MSAPDVSVLVPVHNGEAYLARCLRSLVAQTMPRDHFEIIVINDGSSDRTSFVMDMFADEIVALALGDNLGLPAALNAGLAAARGSYIVRVDADDYVNESFLSILHMFMSANAEFDAVACDYLLVTNEEEVLGRGNCEKEPIACGVMFLLAHLQSIGLYDETFRTHEDLDLRHRFLANHSIYRVPLPLYRYRRHETNMTNDEENSAMFLEMLQHKHGLETH
jgi:glycosyltransferase involved in cell wall biosynthesis